MIATDLSVQNVKNFAFIGTSAPRFSYMLTSEKNGDFQSAYQILVASSVERLNEESADFWNSGKVASCDNFAIEYKGKKLSSRDCVFWKVKVWDSQGIPSVWSNVSSFEIGFLDETDWSAEWIGQGDDFQGNQNVAPVVAGDFAVQDLSTVKKARLYISGLGLFSASLNGKQVTENLFEPGESEYCKRVFYVVYDVLQFLNEGENELQAIVGNGQYSNFEVAPVMKHKNGALCETHRYQKDDSVYLKSGICGKKKLIAQLEMTRENGKTEIVAASSEKWRISESAITFQNWYGGEDFSGKLANEAIDTKMWNFAKKMLPPKGKLTLRESPPIRIKEKFMPESVTKLPNGNYLVDFGKNVAGFVKLELFTKKEDENKKISLYPAEILKSDGSGVDQSTISQSWTEIYSCCVKDTYTIAGTGFEKYRPTFAYHGFRYVEVEGFPGTPTKENFECCTVCTDNVKFSSFLTDNEILNKINEITERSIESNMMSTFTDCPHIEKLGWLETTHLMFSSIASSFDIRAWIPKIIQDIEDAQVTAESASENQNETESEGFVPAIAPEYFRINNLYKDPNWGGACILTPWNYYWEYGDKTVLKKHYKTMKLYLDHLQSSSENNLLKNYAQMGDWGQLNENTPLTIVATCSFYLQTVTFSKIASILEIKSDQEKYTDLAEKIRKSFYSDSECYQKETKTFGNGSQSSYGCVLFSGIAKLSEREIALKKLVESVRKSNNHLTSGEVGLKQVFNSLALGGRSDVVYEMVTNKTQPSYRYFVEKGLTSLPEYWNYEELWYGMERSRNHAMMGHVKEWLNRFILGILPIEAGYKKIRIKPFLPENVRTVQGTQFTVRGNVKVKCTKTENFTELSAEIPVGAEAEIYIPIPSKNEQYQKETVKSGVYFWRL